MITEQRYCSAVRTLIEIAQGDTGGSRVAAQVLLSAYNGDAFQFNIVELGILDQKHYQAALAVIQGRVELGREPHLCIDNGGRIFEALWEQWKAYHISVRGKTEV